MYKKVENNHLAQFGNDIVSTFIHAKEVFDRDIKKIGSLSITTTELTPEIQKELHTILTQWPCIYEAIQVQVKVPNLSGKIFIPREMDVIEWDSSSFSSLHAKVPSLFVPARKTEQRILFPPFSLPILPTTKKLVITPSAYNNLEFFLLIPPSIPFITFTGWYIHHTLKQPPKLLLLKARELDKKIGIHIHEMKKYMV
jgi:hypothetical protein